MILLNRHVEFEPGFQLQRNYALTSFSRLHEGHLMVQIGWRVNLRPSGVFIGHYVHLTTTYKTECEDMNILATFETVILVHYEVIVVIIMH